MEFIAGVITTLFVEFIGYKIYQSRQRKKARAAYIPPSGPRPDMPRDFEDHTNKNIP